MPTSSIFTNFVIEGEEQIEKFISALEESEKLREHMRRRKGL